MEKPYSVCEIDVDGNQFFYDVDGNPYFESVCDVKGHLFLDGYSEYDIDGEFDGNLYAKCFVCENLIKFWHYSSEMVDAVKSKEKCC